VVSARRALGLLLLSVLVATAVGCAAPAARPAPRPARPRLDLATPLPQAFALELPRESLPARIAALGGIWKGDWQAETPPAGALAVPHTLVVTRVDGTGPTYTAPVIWSWAPGPEGAGFGEPRFWEVQADIDAAGELAVVVPDLGRATYRLAPDCMALTGTLAVPGRTLRGTFRRYPEWGVPLGFLRALPAAARQSP
jgi:hypothetical protein